MKAAKASVTLDVGSIARPIASPLARAALCLVLLMCATNAYADGGLGSLTWESIKDLWAPLLAYGLLTYALLFALGVAAFIFVALHCVLLVLLVRAAIKQNFHGKGLRYTVILLSIGYAGIVALTYFHRAD